jgi:hypothetical protein
MTTWSWQTWMLLALLGFIAGMALRILAEIIDLVLRNAINELFDWIDRGGPRS